MLKARLRGQNGDAVLILVTDENIRRIRDGRPLKCERTADGMALWSDPMLETVIVGYGGRTQESLRGIAEALQRGGLSAMGEEIERAARNGSPDERPGTEREVRGTPKIQQPATETEPKGHLECPNCKQALMMVAISMTAFDREAAAFDSALEPMIRAGRISLVKTGKQK